METNEIPKEGEDDPEDADDAMDKLSEFEESVKKEEERFTANMGLQDAFLNRVIGAYRVYCINLAVKHSNGYDIPLPDTGVK